MYESFRLRPADQQTAAVVLAISTALLFGYSAVTKYDTPTAKPYKFSINVNAATQGELQMLPGIGPKLAESIIQYRDQHAPFNESIEIINVKGIGTKKFHAIKPYLSE